MDAIIKKFIMGVLSSAIVSVLASSVAVYVAIQTQQVKIEQLEMNDRRITQKLDKIQMDFYKPRVQD